MYKHVLRTTVLVLVWTHCTSPDPCPEAQALASVDGICPDSALQLGLSYPPVQNATQQQFTRSQAQDLKVKWVRFSEHWDLREDDSGQRNWTPLQDRINSLGGLKIMLTIEAMAPARYCTAPPSADDVSCIFSSVGLNAFDDYVRELLQVVGGQIEILQFGNEWTSDYHFRGDAQDYVAAYQIVDQAVADSGLPIRVTPGGLATAALRVMAACAGQLESIVVAQSPDQVQTLSGQALQELCDSTEVEQGQQKLLGVLQNVRYDLFDIHLYDVEDEWPAIVTTLRQAPYNVVTPLMSSEFGGPSSFFQATSPNCQAQAIDRYVATISTLDLDIAMHFKLVQSDTAHASHVESGLFTQDLRAKPARQIFKTWATCFSANP